MGILRPHVSRHVSGRAPRRGRRPRRPASAHLRIPAHSRLSFRRGRRPRRPVFRSPIAGCTRVLHVCLRREYFALRRDILLPTAAKGCKNAAKDPWSLEFLSSACNHGAKRSHNESPVLLSPLPLPRTARQCAGLSAACWHAILQNTLRSSVYFAAQRAAPAHAAAGGKCAI